MKRFLNWIKNLFRKTEKVSDVKWYVTAVACYTDSQLRRKDATDSW